jgi:hypothetical protein
VSLRINDVAEGDSGPGFVALRRTWHDDTVQLRIPRGLTCHPLAGRGDLVAFRDGPLALAGLTTHQPTLVGDRDHPGTFIDRIGEWYTYHQDRYAVRGQADALTLAPLRDVVDEPFTLYFPLRQAPSR